MKDSSALSAAKRALLERRLQGAPAKPQDAADIPRRSDPSTAPLSFIQRQMWLIEQLAPGNPAYHLPYGFRIRGALDVAALEASFHAVFARHEALRTTFAVRDGEPLQQIHSQLSIAIRLVCLKHLDDAEREARLQALASEEALAPFDLSRLPLIRVSLFALADAESVLIVNLHHLIADGLSIALLLEELDAGYRALLAGSALRMPEMTVQYGDFAQWQQQSAARNGHARQVEYWKATLGGALPVLDLPADHPRPARKSFRGANAFFGIPAALAQKLKELGARERCTPYMTLFAAFQLLLHRYSGADDIIIGTPSSQRTANGVQALIGNFLNVLALRCDLSGDPEFVDLLRRSRDRMLDAFSNADVTFETLLRHLRLERDPSRDPIFQVMLQVLPPMAPRIAELEVSPFHFDGRFAQFDLALHLYEEPAGGFCGRFEYCADLFEADRVERMASNFQQLLRAIVANPREKISRMPLLSTAERNRVLHEWNSTDADLGPELLLHQRFELQARRTPELIALEFEGQKWTYAELNRRANQLARLLRSRGVGPGTLVGVLAERSFEMVASLYAVLKAGGAYVPLDPSYPPERLRNMLEDARAPLVLAQPGWVGLLPRDMTEVIPLDASWRAYEGERSEDLGAIAAPEDLAYVIFTSGSTGRPKGAMNAHRGICNRLQWMQQQHALRTDDCVLQKTPFSFDVSIWEFFCPLAAGARLLIARPEGHKDASYLVRAVRDGRVSTLHFVPSMLHAFLEEPGVEACTSLRRVICIGEALSGELQQTFFSRMPGVELHNQYGPTEAGVDVTHWECRPGDLRATVPIGRPGPNTRIYILDQCMHPVPIGVPGELYIGGLQVGLGYVGRSDLTAERFLPDPFSGQDGARLYRTGDQARFLSDGAIEFLGRLDYQVKLRGQRIELGEIEATLHRHREVKQSVVAVRKQAGAQRLVAYIVSREGVPSANALKEHLRTTLPQYMLPDDFVFLEALPLTSNGKVDRKQLPAPEAAQAPRTARTPPRTHTEQMVMRAFCELLERTDFDVFDNFFDLGGHSLAAARLMSKLRRASGLDLPLPILFERPTVDRLAEAIDMLAWTDGARHLPAAATGDRMEIEL